MLLILPSECILAVLKSLPLADLLAAGCCCSALNTLVADDQFWQNLAEAKWGIMVHQLKPLADKDRQQRACTEQTAEGSTAVSGSAQAANTAPATQCKPVTQLVNSCWMDYCRKRMSLTSIRHSPFALLQELYPDPWQHMVCCVLCSRTSGSTSIRDCIAGFFEMFPTPTACLQAPTELMLHVLHPLGLPRSRLEAVSSICRDFLATDWKEPSEFHGCGKFVTNSWRIFTQGCKDATGVRDAKLKQYLSWVNKMHQGTHLCDMNTAADGRWGTPVPHVDREQKPRGSAARSNVGSVDGAPPSRATRLQARLAAEGNARAADTIATAGSNGCSRKRPANRLLLAGSLPVVTTAMALEPETPTKNARTARAKSQHSSGSANALSLP